MMNQPYFLWDDRRFVKLNLDEIMILKAEDNYLKFLAKEYSYLVRTTLDRTLSQLSDSQFIRIHRSFAISLHYLEEVGKDMVLVGGIPLPLSKKFYPELMSSINIIAGDTVSEKRKGLK